MLYINIKITRRFLKVDRNKQYLLESILMALSKKIKLIQVNPFMTYEMKEVVANFEDKIKPRLRHLKINLLEWWYDEDAKLGRLSVK